MNLFLEFNKHLILGQGTDYVGPWNISGTFVADSNQCHWTKRYIGKHAVQYQGVWSDTGIRGRWTIGDLISGDFHVWPAEMTENQAFYLEQEAQTDIFSKGQ